MELEGRVWKNGKFWLVEVPVLDVMTQGRSKKEALEMITDAVTGLIESYFCDEIEKGFQVQAVAYKEGVIGVTATDPKLLMSLSLIKQREKSQSTIREVSERLGSSSPNAYAPYEKGKTSVSIEKFEALLLAVNPAERRHIRVC